MATTQVTTNMIADGAVTAAKTTGIQSVPTGAIVPFAGASAPSDWLLCYGQAVSRTTYSALFTAISTTYGVGDGSTTFNLPDLRGRIGAGKDDMGGAAASRLTSAGSGVDGATLGDAGGSETHTLTDAQLPSTAIRDTTATTSVATGDTGPANVAANTNTTFGSGDAHNNTQPTIVLNYIIRT